MATLRVTPPTPPEISDDLATIRVEKPAPSPTQAARDAVSVMGANPDSPIPFEFGRRIAKGGMGAILEGSDCKLGRKIAVKVMLDADASADQKQRFVQEAAVLGRLEHPNIVPIHDLGRDSEGALYYTMKLVKGVTLQDIIDRLRREDPATLEHYTLDRLLTIFRKVCDALAFAHAQHIIHRDLKPENIMVGEFGEVLVMDWGIAKILGELGSSDGSVTGSDGILPSSMTGSHRSLDGTASFTATMEGAVMGTPNYMSPEQAMGKVNELDERSDIFSLGSILYAILTLRPPVEGKDVWEVLEKVQMGNITSPTLFEATTSSQGTAKEKGKVLEAKKITPLPHMPGGRVPPALSAVAMKALTLDKAKRYQHVAAFSADIEAFQGGFATSAEGAGLTKQLVLLIKRNKGIFATTAAAWLLICGLVLWFIIGLRASEMAANAALARSAISLAEAALREENGPAMQTALKDVPEDLRNSTWRYLLRQSDSSIASVSSGMTEIHDSAPDPSRAGVFAVVDRSGQVTLVHASTGESLLMFESDLPATIEEGSYSIAFSPDGRHLAVGHALARDIVICRASDGATIQRLTCDGAAQLEFGSGGTLMSRTRPRGNGMIQVWDYLKGTLLWEQHRSGNIGVRACFMPGGDQILVYTKDDRLQILNAIDGSLIRRVGGRLSSYNWYMAVRSDGLAAFTINENLEMECVSLENGQTLFTLPGKRKRFWMGITGDGSQLVTAAALADGIQSIEVWNTETGARIRSLLGGRGEIRDLCIHPASNELLIAGADSRIWDLTGPPPNWRVDSGSMIAGPFSFWGADDLVLGGSETQNSYGLRRLQPDGLEAIWNSNFGNNGTCAVSDDGSLAAISSPGIQKEIQLLRTNGLTVEQVGSIARLPAHRLRLSPSGDRLAILDRPDFSTRLAIVDTASGRDAEGPDLTDVKRLTDLRWVGQDRLLGLVTMHANRGNTGADERIVLWDAATGEVIRSISFGTSMDALAISPDGNRFAEAGVDKRVRIRDVGTLAVRQEFRVHDAAVSALAWHPTKSVIATASADFSVKIWNLETEQPLLHLRGFTSPPVDVKFSPSGQRIGVQTGGQGMSGMIRIWEIGSQANRPRPPIPQTPVSVALPTPEPIHTSPELEEGADGWLDLLSALSPKVVEQTGQGWHLKEDGLFSPNAPYGARLPLTEDLQGKS